MIRVILITILFTLMLGTVKAQVVVNEPATISDMLDRYIQLKQKKW